MDIIVSRLKESHKSIRGALIATFVMNLICTSLLLMFAFGLQEIRNETLSKNDYDQLMTIIASIISVAVLSIGFIQWIIGVEVKALFKARRDFNINMRLMGVSDKELSKIYQKELLRMQVMVIPISIILVYIIYLLISHRIPGPRIIGLDKIIFAILIHFFSIFISMKFFLRKLVEFNVAFLMRGETENTTYSLSKTEKIFAVIGCIAFFIAIILGFLFKNNDNDLLYIFAILFMADALFYIFSKWIINIGDNLGCTYIAMAERIQLGSYKKIKSTISMLGIGLMLFLGLQALFVSARLNVKNVGQENINYESYLLFDKVVENKDIYSVLDSENNALGLNYAFYIPESKYAKYLYGIDKQFLSFEEIKIDNNLIELNIEESIEDPNWNGIILSSALIGSDNIGEEVVLTIDNKDITFVIEGGYWQNVFDKDIWFASKAYIQKQLGLEGYSNAIYMKGSDDKVISSLKPLGGIKVESKESIIEESIRKVVRSTEIVEITSLIIIFCAIISLVSYLVLEANESIKNIAKFRSAGMGVGKAKLIYIIQLIGVIIKGFIIGVPLALLFGKVALRSMYLTVNPELIFPYTTTVVLFVLINLIILLAFYMSTKDGFDNDFTMILRKNDVN